MPNWCANHLTISGHKDDLNTLMEDIPELTLEAMCPLPDGEWNYHWCVDNWDTKWDIDPQQHSEPRRDYLIEYEEFWGESLPAKKIMGWNKKEGDYLSTQYYFNTAWAPPVRALAETYPKLLFTLTYAEAGMGFCGQTQFFNGELYSETYENNVYENEAITQAIGRSLMTIMGG